MEPLLFQRYEGYLFTSLEECCREYYPWALEECMDPSAQDPCYSRMEIYDGDFRTKPERGYYPVWDEGSTYCVSDGKPPGCELLHLLSLSNGHRKSLNHYGNLIILFSFSPLL